MFKIAIRFFAVLFLVVPMSAMAEIKIGFVNMVELMEKSPQAEIARKGLESEFSSRDKKLTAVRDEVLKHEETLKNDGPIMNDKNRADLEKKILNRKREYNRQQDELREDFNIRRNEELGKLQKKVHEVIVVVAKAENYDLVVTQPVLYASEKIDLTERVLQEMQKQ
ncbi:MAG: OmpH family outer membrane protein [Gammaproteobacteria bacterium]|nr:MAG: OmpH family outer membrane protein [Gammaproteobacteria bacterium]